MKFKNIIVTVMLVAVFLGQLVYILSNAHKYDSSEPSEVSSQLAAQEAPIKNEYFKSKVVGIISQSEEELQTQSDISQFLVTQVLDIEVTAGDNKGEKIELENRYVDVEAVYRELAVGDKIVVARTTDNIANFVSDSVFSRYRFDNMMVLVVVFALLVLAVGLWRGLFSMIGLVGGLSVLYFYTVPAFISGSNILITTLISAILISIVSIVFAHGLRTRTALSLVGVLFSLFTVVTLSIFFADFINLFGVGDDNAFYLKIGDFSHINLRGLLVSGVIIASIGILDDVASTQAATVEELSKANKALGFTQLFRRGMSVGREHVASMVNSLVLVYIGASLPLFLLLFMNDDRPIDLILNSEIISEEIFASVVASMGLVLAVPLTTFLAAWWFGRRIG